MSSKEIFKRVAEKVGRGPFSSKIHASEVGELARLPLPYLIKKIREGRGNRGMTDAIHSAISLRAHNAMDSVIGRKAKTILEKIKRAQTTEELETLAGRYLKLIYSTDGEAQTTVDGRKEGQKQVPAASKYNTGVSKTTFALVRDALKAHREKQPEDYERLMAKNPDMETLLQSRVKRITLGELSKILGVPPKQVKKLRIAHAIKYLAHARKIGIIE